MSFPAGKMTQKEVYQYLKGEYNAATSEEAKAVFASTAALAIAIVGSQQVDPDSDAAGALTPPP